MSSVTHKNTPEEPGNFPNAVKMLVFSCLSRRVKMSFQIFSLDAFSVCVMARKCPFLALWEKPSGLPSQAFLKTATAPLQDGWYCSCMPAAF